MQPTAQVWNYWKPRWRPFGRAIIENSQKWLTANQYGGRAIIPKSQKWQKCGYYVVTAIVEHRCLNTDYIRVSTMLPLPSLAAVVRGAGLQA